MDEKKTARAEAKYVRIAPRKIQIICDMIRGEKTEDRFIKMTLAIRESA